MDEEFSLNKKKKKKKVKINDTDEILGLDEPAAAHKMEEGEYTKTDEDYTYDQVELPPVLVSTMYSSV